MELVDVPGIYNAYDTVDPDKVDFTPRTENFDSAWVIYHWDLKYLGKTKKVQKRKRYD